MILGISGRKQAGKNTTANILHGIVLKEQGFIKDWNLGSNGQLLIPSDGGSGWGEFWIERKDEEFVTWADNNMWPFVKLYSFADHLKTICMELFDIPFRCLYGTDAEKNQTQEHLLWENMPGVVTDSGADIYGDVQDANKQPLTWPSDYSKLTTHEPGPMTAREFMQFLGTDVMRKMYEPVWVKSCIEKIQKERSQLAIIADIRFPNEAKAVEQAGGKVVRLTREVHEDKHSSEVALDDYPFTDYIDNKIESIDVLMVKVKEFYRNLKERHVSNLC
jgi:hypothetical protein